MTVEEMGPAGPATEGIVLNLYVMVAEGGEARQITYGPHQDYRPSFSPDGNTVVFVSNRSGMRQLWTVTADGSAEPVRLQQEGWGFRPWFAHDAASIYFFTDVDGRHRICRMSAADGSWTPLSNDDAGSSHGPFVDQDGATLLMHSTRQGPWSIWEVPLDGRTPRELRPPSFRGRMSHATRSNVGTITFDSPD
jgi:TolB protein